jgi:hypothetical protein
MLHNQRILAEDNENVISLAACFPETNQRFRLIAMWVTPTARETGVEVYLIRRQ